ncbi:hypothetical protein Sbal625DRAFT_1820 [Shewanella baltica OS625]|nr:hypothetical protein Sbal678_2811 [Shewanella baltica OS678]EHC06142.1 hypothetical protein Sbal625DRAFT_1820 [Shewanella baltica OS625]
MQLGSTSVMLDKKYEPINASGQIDNGSVNTIYAVNTKTLLAPSSH